MAIDILTLAAAKATAGGGGGSTSKYKQPDWGAGTAIVEFMPEAGFQLLESMEGMVVFDYRFPYTFIDGSTYEISYNGVNYNCVCHAIVVDSNGVSYAFGNIGAIEEGLPVTDDPFVFLYNDDIAWANMGVPAMAVPLDGSTYFTMSIKGETETVYPIPGKYLESAEKPLVVTLQEGGNAFDVDFAEILTAIRNGRIVYLYDINTGSMCNFSYAGNETILFTHMTVNGSSESIVVNTVELHNDNTASVKTAFVASTLTS